jgi:hypothetical protein
VTDATQTPIDLIDPVPERKPRKRNGDGRAVAKVEAAPAPAPVPASETAALLQTIERLAVNPNANPDQVERFLGMYERITAQRNEREFNDKMANAQKEMRPVAADANNPQTKSKYASYAALDRALRPVYTQHGFALSFNTLPDAPESYVRVVCDVTNAGHTRRYQIDMPADGKGAKGGDVMTKTHATGSAVSYGMRYLLKMIFNIAVGEADDDGNAAGRTEPVERITEKQVSDLNALLQKSPEPAANVQIIFEHFKIDNLSELTPEQYRKTVSQLSKKLELQGA